MACRQVPESSFGFSDEEGCHQLRQANRSSPPAESCRSVRRAGTHGTDRRIPVAALHAVRGRRPFRFRVGGHEHGTRRLREGGSRRSSRIGG